LKVLTDKDLFARSVKALSKSSVVVYHERAQGTLCEWTSLDPPHCMLENALAIAEKSAIYRSALRIRYDKELTETLLTISLLVSLDSFEASEEPSNAIMGYLKWKVTITDDEKMVGRYTAWRLLEGHLDHSFDWQDECLEFQRILFGLLIQSCSLRFSSVKQTAATV
jgi:hypothetical protein